MWGLNPSWLWGQAAPGMAEQRQDLGQDVGQPCLEARWGAKPSHRQADRLVRLINSPELMKNRTLVLICVTHAVQECTAAFRGLCSPSGDEADGTRAPSAAGGTGGCGQHGEHKDTR